MAELDEVTEPTEAEVIFTAIRRGLRGVHTTIPGKVTAYAEGVADVQLTVEIETREGNYETVPPLKDVPVAWPISQAFYLHFPLDVGDSVTVHFYEQDPTQWFVKESIETPAVRRRHGFYPVAIPGPATLAKRLTAAEAPSGKAVFGARGGAVVAVSSSEVQLGSLTATDPVALATALDTWTAAFVSWAEGHIHNDPVSGVTSAPTVAPPAEPTTAATKVKGV